MSIFNIESLTNSIYYVVPSTIIFFVTLLSGTIEIINLYLIGFYVNWYGTTKALRLNANISEEGSKLPSLPSYYGTHSFLWLIIPVITLLIFWFFFKPFIMDLFLSKYISSKLDSSFTGDPSMLIDTVKATTPEKVFPGTNPLIVESAKYYKQLYLRINY